MALDIIHLLLYISPLKMQSPDRVEFSTATVSTAAAARTAVVVGAVAVDTVIAQATAAFMVGSMILWMWLQQLCSLCSLLLPLTQAKKASLNRTVFEPAVPLPDMTDVLPKHHRSSRTHWLQYNTQPTHPFQFIAHIKRLHVVSVAPIKN